MDIVAQGQRYQAQHCGGERCEEKTTRGGSRAISACITTCSSVYAFRFLPQNANLITQPTPPRVSLPCVTSLKSHLRSNLPHICSRPTRSLPSGLHLAPLRFSKPRIDGSEHALNGRTTYTATSHQFKCTLSARAIVVVYIRNSTLSRIQSFTF
jgi:hypothetical protein